MKKLTFYTELSYLLGLIIIAFSAALAVKADFGVSMVIAPAYILHLKVSEYLPWFTFGVAEYLFQGFLVIVTTLIMRRFRLSYLFSFVTAVLYGTLVDAASLLLAGLPTDTIAVRLVWYVAGIVLCSFAVSLFFHTYISPEAYELIVKELAAKTRIDISKVKTAYDLISAALGIVLSFSFFGFGVFEGVKWGTIVCAFINGWLIGRFSKLLERFFVFKNKFPLEKYFI